MPKPVPPFSALRVLEAACRLRSYSAAGQELGVTHSAVSQAIRRLEIGYAQRLFWRKDNEMAPTAAAIALGGAYRDAARIVERAADDLEADVSGRPLVVSTLPSVAMLWLSPRLKRLRDALPDVALEVRTSRDLADLDSDGVDVALRVGEGRWPGLRCELLFEEYVFPVCSPEFLEVRRPTGDADIAHLPLILEDVDLWPAWFAAAGVSAPRRLRGPSFQDSSLTVEAAAAGIGVALVRRLHAQEALRAGRLVRMSATRIRDPYSCYLVWRDENPRIDAIRRFCEWVLAECDRAGLLAAA
ncbi:MAG TPA: LysR substrate-binding domain-containing protein [Caulobacteraceae bacterium]|nr:LysR substrate-binding domain-containing protein [Caulobacteraceae bacterium]